MSNETVTVQETANQEGSEKGNAPLNNWDAITNAEEFNTESFTPKADDVKTDEVEELADEAKEDKPNADAEVKDETKTDEKPETEKKDTEVADETKEGDKPLIEFKAEDVVNETETDPAEGTFLALAKAQGIELKEDSFEAYQLGIEEKYNAKVEEVKKTTEDTVLAKYSPEARATIELLNSGLSLEQIYAPLQEVQQLKALDDVSLVRKALEEATMPDGVTKMWDADMVEAQMEKMLEKGDVDQEAKKIRRILDANEQEIKIEHSQKLKQFQDRKEQQVRQEKQESVAQFTKAMNTVSEFMGGKISEDAKQAIIKKQQSGAYDNVLSDPKNLAEFILYKEFGQKAIKNIENTAFQKGREEKTKKLLNIPPVTQNGGGRVITNNEANNWDALKEGFGK